MSTYQEISEKLREIKDKSEIALYLAYSSILYESKSIAKGVLKFEEEIDKLRAELQKLLIEEAEKIGTETAMAVMLLVESMERISDFAKDLAFTVLRGEEVHPVLELAGEETNEQVLIVKVDENSVFLGKRIGDLSFDDRIGVRVVAVRHKDVWVYDPNENIQLEKGDLLLLSGYREGIEILEEAEEEAEDIE
ncbi:MAG: TrkA C-terminal domain-containing protein [Candidatus Bathyarchaeia archaeon]